MSSRQDDVVRSLLRPSENLRCILDVERAADDAKRTPQNRADPTDTPLRRRLIAVVAHRDYSQDTEVGSLLVLSAGSADVLQVVDAVPITERLVLAVAQTGPINSPAVEHDQGVPTESWSAWLLSIKRDAQDTRPLAFRVRTRNTQKLQSLAAEYRRLKEIAAMTHPASADFAWVDAYVTEPSSSTRPNDLRLRNKPLHKRLSPAIAGLPGDDVSDISLVRREWIERAATKEASSGNVKHLKIRIGTFNVNGKTPSQDLYPWLRSSEPEGQRKSGWISPLKLSPFEVTSDLRHQELQEDEKSLASMTDSTAFGDSDMLVLGFQELDQSTEALLYATSTLKEDEWLTAIFAGLGEKRVLYEKLTSRQLVGMLLIVIVKKVLVPCFTDIRSCDAGSGIMGFMGNKGATAIRLKFTPKVSSGSQSTICRSTVLTFVNAHLAASDEMVERRNYDFQELSNRLAFSPSGLNGDNLPTSFAQDADNIYWSDVLFWMGGNTFFVIITDSCYNFYSDLNYRLDLTDWDIRTLLFSHISGIDSIETLLSYDQLRAAIQNNKAFSGFTECTITHTPTYRLALGVSKDQLGYDIRRKPAWTDRILYMAPPDVRVTQVACRSHSEITMSDHQPLSADFDISLALIDRSKYENVVLALQRELADFGGSESKPKIKIQPSSIDFGAIKYRQIVDRKVIIRNEGDIPCVFRFVAAGADLEHVSPSWLRIEPIVGLLRPREASTVFLSAYVDNETAADLNFGSPRLGCTLILHTALGKDDFIVVAGNYQYTCFANTLERLTRLAGPIRKLGSPEQVLPAEQAISAPTEVVRLINWLMTHVSATEDALFAHPPQERLCHVIRECLDTGDEFPSEGPDGSCRELVAAFASTLVAFLDSLIEPVVPARLHTQCLQTRDKDEAFEVLSAFPHESINVWISLTAFLHYIAQQSEPENESDQIRPRMAHKLASVFAPVLLRDDPTGVYPRASPVGKQDFLLRFID